MLNSQTNLNQPVDFLRRHKTDGVTHLRHFTRPEDAVTQLKEIIGTPDALLGHRIFIPDWKLNAKPRVAEHVPEDAATTSTEF